MLYWRILFTRPLELLSSSSAKVEKKKKGSQDGRKILSRLCIFVYMCQNAIIYQLGKAGCSCNSSVHMQHVLLHYDTTSPSTSFKKKHFYFQYMIVFSTESVFSQNTQCNWLQWKMCLGKKNLLFIMQIHSYFCCFPRQISTAHSYIFVWLMKKISSEKGTVEVAE